jgi:hypothetical protein
VPVTLLRVSLPVPIMMFQVSLARVLMLGGSPCLRCRLMPVLRVSYQAVQLMML